MILAPVDRGCFHALKGIVLLCIAALLVGLPCAAQEIPSDALVLLTVEGDLQLWWPRDARVINVDLSEQLPIQNPAPFARVAAGPEGIYVLDTEGRLFSVLERKQVFELPSENAHGVDLIIDRSGSFLWVLDNEGGLYPVHFSGEMIGPPLTSPDVKTTCAVAQGPDGRLWTADTEGTLTSPRDYATVPPKQPFAAHIVDLEFNPARPEGFILDSSGSLYAWGGEREERLSLPSEFTRQSFVELGFSPSATDSYYILSRLGSVFYSGSGSAFKNPEPSSAPYCGFAVVEGQRLAVLWRDSFPSLSVWVQPTQLRVPYWRRDFRFQVMCGQARDITEFDCRLAFNPEVLAPKQIFPGELSDPAELHPTALDDSHKDEGIAEILGISLDKRSGGGMTGSGSLFEIEMEILKAGNSELRIQELRATSASLPDSLVNVSDLGGGEVQVYFVEPTIYLNLQSLPLETLSDEGTPLLGNRKVRSGERFNVYLQVNHVKAMKGLRYDLSFEPDVIELLAVEESRSLAVYGPTLFLSDPVESTRRRGELVDQGVAILGQGAGLDGPGEIARYLFQARRPGKATVRLTQAVLVNEARDRRPLEVSGAQVDIEVVENE